MTTCAVCDAPFYKGEDVVVVGGGDSAAEEAMQLAQYVKTVTILVRGSTMRATAIMQQRLSEYQNVQVRFNTQVTAIRGNDAQVTEIEVLDTKNRMTGTVAASGLFLAIGHVPDTQLFTSFVNTHNGYITLQGRSQQTSRPGIFAAGDVEDAHYRQAAVASASGVKAAMDADAFLSSIGLSPQIAEQLNTHLFKQAKPKRTMYTIDSLSEFTALSKEHTLVVVYFYQDDCPTCNQVDPLFDAVAQDFSDKATFARVNAGIVTDMVEKFFVSKVPSILVWENGQLVGRYSTIIGDHSDRITKQDVMQFIVPHIGDQ